MAESILWNDGWEFCERELTPQNMSIPETGEWHSVDLPHDYMIYDTHSLYRTGIGWYRKTMQRKNTEPEEEILLRFDGVYMDSAVFVNGSKAGEWKYGYSAFEVELTPFLQPGENLIAVRVVYQSPNTRWYSGAGIYRNVWLKTRNRSHILSDGIYITPVKETDNTWRVETDTELFLGEAGETGFSKSFSLEQSLYDEKGNLLAKNEVQIDRAQKNDGNEKPVSLVLGPVENPLLWDIGQGNLYTVETSLKHEGRVLDRERQKIGFRTMEFLPDKGFLLNGRRVKVNGVCEHHDFGALGAAFHKEAARRKLQLLRQMGVAAVRTSHNMPAKEFMELADEMGFLIVSEAFDMWENPKTTYDYARFFDEWYEKDVSSWIRRDRNHACLMMWSMGNEIQDTMEQEKGPALTAKLKEAVRKQDWKCHAPVTVGSNYMKWENPQKCAEALDCVGYNYGEYLYEQHHREHKDWVIYGSETCSVLASRGIYHFPLKQSLLTDEDEQCSALGNSVTGWGAAGYEACIGDDRDTDCSMGQFIWTGFDYIGESTPYETKNSYYGQMDTAGFPKDSFYIFQSEWTDAREKPMVHLFPYWDFNEGQLIDVQALTNGARVELFVNGRSLGSHSVDHQKGRDQIGTWHLPYEKGEITAVAYDEEGREIARKSRHSFGDAAEITVSAHKGKLRADGQDLLFLEIGAKDENGYVVENANNRVHVEVEGAGRLLGLDNGDSADFDAYKGKSRRLFGGRLLAIIGSKKTPGTITVKLTSPGLPEKSIELTAEALKEEEKDCLRGISAEEENREYPLYGGGSKGQELSLGEQEIPIRKIELKAEKKRLTKEEPETEIRVMTHPVNATYHDLTYLAVNDAGIEVNYVELSPFAGGVRVKALGDGDFRLKCCAKNGGSGASVQSVLEMQAQGMGRAYLNPYEEIPAGLCDYRTEKAVAGIEHGINFTGGEKGKKECVIGFTGVDFGEKGTEEITLPIFANTNDPVTFEIWSGKPWEEGSELLADCFYHKPPKWLVFQEESYALKEILRGRTSLYLATDDSFQLRGIRFQKLERAYKRQPVVECDSVYGDTYKVICGKLEGIGNNVSIVFEHMDFGTEGTEAVTMRYRTGRDFNPVQLRFSHAEGNHIQMIEAKKQEEYGEVTYTIEKIRGCGTLQFIFLPGSCFDFDWFEFHR